MTAVLCLGGLFGAVGGVAVFFDRSGALYLDYDFSTDTSFWTSAACFTFTAALLVAVLAERSGGRDRFTYGLGGSLLACGAAGVWLGRNQADDATVNAVLLLTPATATILLAVAVLARNAISRPWTDEDAEEWQAGLVLRNAREQASTGDLDDLPRASVEALLADRRLALETLAGRGLLPVDDVDAVAARPLGRLADDSSG
ncbi:hypothetical protein KUV85_12715 [Nocardioides panacisoli]|uniref:hypothetical protein n=1 Tax=Nocardioides panacisoli TaxID=627624 RepID=UPI001C632B8B|nr:hypothetical protein [Nocardioides panacisoli]QYJ03194.1 hypothetical protein KUV85_12715 [Nocardioides panacisoli]